MWCFHMEDEDQRRNPKMIFKFWVWVSWGIHWVHRHRKSGGENSSSRGQKKSLYLDLCYLRDLKMEHLLWIYDAIGLAFENLRIKILKSVSLSIWWEDMWTHFNSICIWKSLKGAGNWEKADLALHWVTGILKKYESGCYRVSIWGRGGKLQVGIWL